MSSSRVHVPSAASSFLPPGIYLFDVRNLTSLPPIILAPIRPPPRSPTQLPKFRNRNRQAHHRILRPRDRDNREIPGGEAIVRIVRVVPTHRRPVSRRHLPPRQEASFTRIPSHHRPPASAHEHHRGRVARPFGPRGGDTLPLPVIGIPIRTDTPHHGLRLRGGGRDVPRHDPERRRRGVLAAREGSRHRPRPTGR